MNRTRIGFALAGFVAALLSVALDDRRLGWAAIALLATALVLRLILGKRENGPSQNGPPV
jgi:hypothetical protein